MHHTYDIITYFLGNCKSRCHTLLLLKYLELAAGFLYAAVAAPQIIYLWETYDSINHIEFAYKKVGLTL